MNNLNFKGMEKVVEVTKIAVKKKQIFFLFSIVLTLNISH